MTNTYKGSGHGRKGESGRRIKRGMDREYGNIGKGKRKRNQRRASQDKKHRRKPTEQEEGGQAK